MTPVTRRELLVLGGLAGAAGLSILVARRLRPPGDLIARSPVLEAAFAEKAPEAGNPAGDLTMLLFTDFNCGGCRSAHPDMLAAVAADGGVRLRFLDWPVLGDASRQAARGALAAAAQGLYLPVHQALMQGGRADGPAAEAALAGAGGDPALLRSTLANDGARLEGQLSRHAFHASSLGLAGTPSYLMGRLRVQGGLSEAQFRAAFSQAREAA